MNLFPSKPAPDPTYHELRSVIRQLHESTEAHQVALHRALHDQLGGLIVSAAMDLSAVARALGVSGLVDFRLTRAQNSMVAAVDLERKLSEELRPSLLDNIGLFAALRWYVRHGCPHSPVVCSEHFPEEEMSLNSDAVTTLYRIGQESLALTLNEPDLKSVDLDVRVDKSMLHFTVAHEHQGPESIDPFDATPGLMHSLLERTRSMAGEMLIGRTHAGTALIHRFKLEQLTLSSQPYDSSDNLTRDLTGDPPRVSPHTVLIASAGVSMSQDQYQKGLSTIRSFVDGALRDRGIVAQAVQLAEQGPQREANLSISANGKTEAAVFSYDEVEDSGEAIDAPTAAKVRQLVSHFIHDNS